MASDNRPLKDVLGIELHPRSSKPRKQGITMVIDIGYNAAMVESVLDLYGHLLDIVKLTELHLTSPVSAVKRKIELYKSRGVGVQPGGIVVELARLQHRGPQVLERLRELGFDHIEVSSSATTQREAEEEKEFVGLVRKLGFTAIGEVGKKFHTGDKTRKSDTELDIEETVAEFKALLGAGTPKAYWEGHVLRRVMGDTAADILARHPHGTNQVLEVARRVGQENIIFEVSSMIPYVQRRAQQFWLVRQFGPEVNMGNVRLEEIQFLEHVRLGTWPVFGFGPLGDHPYMQALERTQGKPPTDAWWQSIAIESAKK
ncbi:MAG: phosphosulfolactate synthase [Alphaproteobacteria bacterium]|nr:phosphosulfolactate synthase [Alphaproteobacteria bacterium]